MKRKRVLNVEGARVTLAPKLQRRSNASLNARQLLCYTLRNTHGRSRYGFFVSRTNGLRFGFSTPPANPAFGPIHSRSRHKPILDWVPLVQKPMR